VDGVEPHTGAAQPECGRARMRASPNAGKPAKRAIDESPWRKPWGQSVKVVKPAKRAKERGPRRSLSVRSAEGRHRLPSAAKRNLFGTEKSPARAWICRPLRGLTERSQPIPTACAMGFTLPPASRAAPCAATPLGEEPSFLSGTGHQAQARNTRPHDQAVPVSPWRVGCDHVSPLERAAMLIQVRREEQLWSCG
jgi:hypothetical protein